MAHLRLMVLVALSGCFAGTVEPPLPSYRNPLDYLDAGQKRVDAGSPVNARSIGTVDGRTPNLSSGIYQVAFTDAGHGTASLSLADVPSFCDAIASDGGLGQSWDVVRFYVDGTSPGAYTVAAILPPGGAVAEFDYQADSGGFGITQATGGMLQLNSIDPNNVQPATGAYTLTFNRTDGGTDSLTGTFVAEPCARVPPKPGS